MGQRHRSALADKERDNAALRTAEYAAEMERLEADRLRQLKEEARREWLVEAQKMREVGVEGVDHQSDYSLLRLESDDERVFDEVLGFSDIMASFRCRMTVTEIRFNSQAAMDAAVSLEAYFAGGRRGIEHLGVVSTTDGAPLDAKCDDLIIKVLGDAPEAPPQASPYMPIGLEELRNLRGMSTLRPVRRARTRTRTRTVFVPYLTESEADHLGDCPLEPAGDTVGPPRVETAAGSGANRPLQCCAEAAASVQPSCVHRYATRHGKIQGSSPGALTLDFLAQHMRHL